MALGLMACSPSPPVPLSCHLAVLCPSPDPFAAPAFGWVLQAPSLPTQPCTRLDGDGGGGTVGILQQQQGEAGSCPTVALQGWGDMDWGDKLLLCLVPPAWHPHRPKPIWHHHHHPAPPPLPRWGFTSPVPAEELSHLHWTRQRFHTATPEVNPKFPASLFRAG